MSEMVTKKAHINLTYMNIKFHRNQESNINSNEHYENSC